MPATACTVVGLAASPVVLSAEQVSRGVLATEYLTMRSGVPSGHPLLAWPRVLGWRTNDGNARPEVHLIVTLGCTSQLQLSAGTKIDKCDD